MNLLTLEQIIALHSMVLETAGGLEGIRDLGALESVVAAQHQHVFGEELYTSIYQKAASVTRGVIAGHVFHDGNKRTAMLAGLTLLSINNVRFAANKGEIEDFAVKVAVDRLDVKHIAQWLKKHAR